MKGIDISTYQRKMQNMNAVKASGVEFAIIKIGEYFNHVDSAFEQHYANFTKAGIPVGVYLFSHAASRESARKEANFALQILNGRALQLPIFIDIEASDSAFSAGASEAMNIANAFCSEIEKDGYTAGIYASASPWKTHLNVEDARAHNRCVWVAHYGVSKPNISYYDIWQSSATGNVDGVITDTDVLINKAFIGHYPADFDDDNCNDSQMREEPIVDTESAVKDAVQQIQSGGYISASRERLKGYSKITLALQALLTYQGFNCTADGYFGNETESKLRLFQLMHGLTADGVANTDTWLKLLEVQK